MTHLLNGETSLRGVNWLWCQQNAILKVKSQCNLEVRFSSQAICAAVILTSTGDCEAVLAATDVSACIAAAVVGCVDD